MLKPNGPKHEIEVGYNLYIIHFSIDFYNMINQILYSLVKKYSIDRSS